MTIKTKYNIGDTLFFMRGRQFAGAQKIRFTVYGIETYCDNAMEKVIVYLDASRHRLSEKDVIGHIKSNFA